MKAEDPEVFYDLFEKQCSRQSKIATTGQANLTKNSQRKKATVNFIQKS